MVARVIRPAFSSDKPKATLRLVEDQDGKRFLLPDGRHVAGVVDVNLEVNPGGFTKMTVVLVEFDVDMKCPQRDREQDGDR